MLNTFLHIGSHKTGTKFFQHKYFPNIKKKGFIYNPDDLSQLVLDLMKADEKDSIEVISLIQKKISHYEKKGYKQLLISKEIMSGDLFSFYESKGYSSSNGFKKLNKAFKNPEIIVSFRFQTDWIVSCYRESIHEHHFQSFKEFAFERDYENDFVNPNYTDLNYERILNDLFKIFAKDKVNVLFYENFKEDKFQEIKKIEKILDVENVTVTDEGDKIPNRGYSAFSINISLFRYRFLRILFLHRFFCHRPIRFFGKKSIPAGKEELSALPKEPYWSDNFLRDNEEVRSKNYPDSLSLIEKFKMKTSWRYITKEIIDKIYYYDWDFIANFRPELDNYFKKRNKEILKQHPNKLHEMPLKYYE